MFWIVKKKDPPAVEEWTNYYLPLAEAGDPGAQIEIGWGSYRGSFGQKDPQIAEVWFRRAAASGAGERAYFELIKMLRIEMSSRVQSVYEERDWSLGAIHFVYGSYLDEIGAPRSKVLSVLERGADQGSLMAQWHLHIVTHKGLSRLLGFPTDVRFFVRLVSIKFRNENDPRTLM